MSYKAHYDKGVLMVPVGRPVFKLPEGFQTRGEFHITVQDIPDGKRIKLQKGFSNKELEDFLKSYDGQEFRTRPVSLGVGYQEQGNNAVYFEVIEWPEVQEWRKSLGLPHKDLHTTIGFIHSDIHQVPKDHTTLVAAEYTSVHIRATAAELRRTR